MTKIKDVIRELEILAPPLLQEKYDNAGLLTGDREQNIKSVLVSLDTTEAVIDEAINTGANLIISHHPIIFSGLKSLTGENYIEKVIIKAIKHDIAIYALHTNLDNVFDGVNKQIAQKLELKNIRILSPKNDNLLKLSVFVPTKDAPHLRTELFKAGAGEIGNYSECSFISEGVGSFKANENASPHVGEIDKIHYEAESKLEVIFPSYLQSQVIEKLLITHPYEEVAYDLLALNNKNSMIGSGMIGDLEEETDELTFLERLKKSMQTPCIRHSDLLGKKISKVAICGGSGDFLLETAIAQKADVFISGDFKYHRFFDADHKLIIMDIGHYESEQFTIDLIVDFLTEKFSTFAIRFTEVKTNPINYF